MIRPRIRRLLQLPKGGRTSLTGEVDEEIGLHLELRKSELMRRGWTAAEAEQEARRRFGDLSEGRRAMRRTATRRTRRMNASEWLATLGQDVRFGARQLRRSPGFTLAAVLTLALGIGANAAIFSFVDGLLLRPPPHVDAPERLVRVYTSDFSGPAYGGSSFRDYLDFGSRLAGTAELAAYSASALTLDAGTAVELLRVEAVTPNYFNLLGVAPAAGRLLGPTGPDPTEAEPVVVLGYDLWQRIFGGAIGVVGEVVRLNGQPATIIGVTPRGFAGPGGRQPADAYVPIGLVPVLQPSANGSSFLDQRGSRGLSIVGRLDPGISVDAVRSRLESIGASLFAEYPDEWTDVRDTPRRVTTLAGRQSWISPTDHGTLVGFAGLLMGLVGLVLLLACANVANLLLARATRRRQEIAVRLAIGAGRGRLVRQLVTESLLLATAGGALGLLFALSSVTVLRRVGEAMPINAAFDVRLDLRVTLFAIGASILAALVFGLFPALITARRDAIGALRNEGTGGGRRGSVLRSGLVAGQVAICVLLLLCASLLVRGLRNAVETELGFDPSSVLLVPLTVAPDRYDADAGSILYQNIVERIGTLPGVTGVALGRQIPLGGRYSRTSIQPTGYQPGASEDMEIDFDVVTPGYLELMRTPILRGRSIDSEDRSGGPQVAVVNEAFADRFWRGEDPLGKTFGFGRDQAPVMVVGVTPTGKVRALEEDPRPIIYLPLSQMYRGDLTLHVRTDGDPIDMLPSVRAELRQIDPEMPITGARTFESVVAAQVLPLRMAGTLFTGFGALALTIAMIGLYGVLAYAVGQRTREIGIRVALGAPGSRVAAGIIGRGMALVAVGAAVGVAAGLSASRPLASILFDVDSTDVSGLGLVLVLLGVVSLGAAFLPARRAIRVDPMVALRQE